MHKNFHYVITTVLARNDVKAKDKEDYEIQEMHLIY